MKFLLFISLVLIACESQHTRTVNPDLIGKVIKIVDGDTYDILLAGNITKRIRMEGIDAPERGMPFYQVSKNYLGQLCFEQTVRIEPTSVDRYGRTIAKTYQSDGRELGFLMIEAGYAWHFKMYSSDIQLANAEIEARNLKAGLWADDNPVAPWEWRKNKRARASR